MQDNLNQKIANATKWSSITEVGIKLITPITNAILARLLAPEAFGVIATLTMVVSFAEIFTDAGFQKYIVQHEYSSKEELDSGTNVAFWTNLVLSLLIWGVIALFATPIANMVGSPGCETAIIVISMEIPLLAFSSIQMARYRRDFAFRGLFAARIVTAMVPLVITVPLALMFKSYWALVLGTLAKDILNAVILTVKSKWKPQLQFSIKRLKKMLSFSIWSVVENVTIWLTGYVGTFIVGSRLSDYYLGLYKNTMNTANMCMTMITAATTPVLFSALSRCQNDDAEFKYMFFRFQRMVAMLVFPLGLGMIVFRELCVMILLGEQWMQTADFFGLWAVMSAIAIIFSHYNSEVFRSKGKPKLSVLTQILHIVVLVPVLLWAVNGTYETLTVARSLVRLQLILVSSIILQIVVGIRFLDIVKNVWPSLISAVVMALAGMMIRTLFSHILWEFISVFLCVLIYTGVMLMIPAGRRQLSEVPVLNKILKNKD